MCIFSIYKNFKYLAVLFLALSLSACVSMIDNNGVSVSPVGDIDIKTNDPVINTLESRLSNCRNAGLKDQNSTHFACVSLLYGTNRGPKKTGDNFYGKSPLPAGSNTRLGEVVVSIPNAHQIGSDIKGADRPVENNETKYRKKVYAIWGGADGPLELTEDQFINFARHKVKGVAEAKKTALVFVHGFNVTFESAAYNTAQLKTDLNVKGPAFFFSWPSNGETLQYVNDQKDADFSAENLANFLLLVKKSVGEETSLSIIAHSMGHRVVGQAFEIIRRENPDTKPIFENGIFASADLDENLFAKWIVGHPDSPKLVKQPILYVTDDDRALNLSEGLLFSKCDDHDRKYRVGLVTKKDCESGKRRVSIFPKPFETIDLSNEPGEKVLGIFGKNHNKYTKSPKVICHMSRLFDGGEVSKLGRNDIVKQVTTTGKDYWITDPKRKVHWPSDCYGANSNQTIDPYLVSVLQNEIGSKPIALDILK